MIDILLALVPALLWGIICAGVSRQLLYMSGEGKLTYISYPYLIIVQLGIGILLSFLSYLALTYRIGLSRHLTASLLVIVAISLLVAGFWGPTPYKAFLAGFTKKAQRQLPITELRAWARQESEVVRTKMEEFFILPDNSVPTFVREFASPSAPKVVLWLTPTGTAEVVTINLGGHFANWGILVFPTSQINLPPNYDCRKIAEGVYAFHTNRGT